MKKLLLAAALLLSTSTLFADASDRPDVLLTPAGRVFMIQSEAVPDDPQARRQLVLSVQEAGQTTTSVVPDSLTSGFRCAPALAYDAQTDTLFAFWLRMPTLMSSELLVASYKDNKWERAISIDNKAFRLRSNLRIAVRRAVAEPQADGSYRDINSLVIHTVWWEETGDGEKARYALLAIERGAVKTIEIHDLSEFAPTPDSIATVDPNFNPEVLKHSAFIDTTSTNSVDVIFGDLKTKGLYRTTLRPIIAQGRIHIPVGHAPVGKFLGVPGAFASDWSGQVSAVVPGSDDGTILLYNVASDVINFLLYADGRWSSTKSVHLDGKLSAGAAVDALSRMLKQ
jgi:hypothetical protein